MHDKRSNLPDPDIFTFDTALVWSMFATISSAVSSDIVNEAIAP